MCTGKLEVMGVTLLHFSLLDFEAMHELHSKFSLTNFFTVSIGFELGR